MSALSKALGLAAAAAVLVPLAPAQAAAPAESTGASVAVHGYTHTSLDDANNARIRELTAERRASLKAGPTKLANNAYYAAQVIYYDTSSAPTYRYKIQQGANIWNSSTNNIDLQPVSSYAYADLEYDEGYDSFGSYAQTYSLGQGYVFFDHTQMSQYSQLRIVTHETGHILGLPDHYSGPCSELMSGGGPGTSCTNAYPNYTERATVDSYFR